MNSGFGIFLNAITEIESYTSGVQIDDFLQNSMMRFASIKQLEIIGEACNHLSIEIKVLMFIGTKL